MRRFALLALLLASCTLTAPGGDTSTGLATDAIEVTPLDGAAAGPAAVGQAEEQAEEQPETAEPADPAPAADDAAEAAADADSDPAVDADPADPATADEESAEGTGETIAEPPPAPVLSPAAQACVKRGGRWIGTGTGLMACVKVTRDAGKSCTRQTDCEGYCLARSRTCAPYTPLFGCNDILQANGQRATLCLD